MALLLPPFSLSVLSLSLLLFLVPCARCSVHPSNNSAQLAWTDHRRFRLLSNDIRLPTNASLVPLTEFLVHLNRPQLETFYLSGTLVNVDATNSLGVQSDDIAFISCDDSAYPGELDASATVSNVLTNSPSPSAVILYSTAVDHCNYTSDAGILFHYIFTLVNPHLANTIQAQLSSADHSPSAHIQPEMSFMSPTTPTPDGGEDDDNPNAGVAMIILYSITGIITALFLGIIITGAVRAHRNPERYGPRYAHGRPRQSRARGIARAMVETIPIVKFGDQQQDGKQDAVKGDVELAVDPEAEHASHSDRTGPSADDGAKNSDSETNEEKPTGPGTAPETGNFSCPICTDDFVKGQDIRVLPCNHQFHPDCVDPWLVNVSGTCPMCRIDLHPEQAKDEDQNQDDESPQDGVAEGQGNRPRRGIATYVHDRLNTHRMREASVEERLAALRSVRAANRENVQAGEEGRGRRSRLTARFRERFRIRTRAHDQG
ncbi:RING finger domain protein [Aspergillus sp. HF37]|nr:RING finger domain protein [Aspergillus sp. HF37]